MSADGFEWVRQPRPARIEQVVVHNDDAPDECAIFDPRRSQITTAWVSASEGSFVSLEEVR